MNHADIIQKIEAHAAERNISPSTVTSRAVGNSRLYRRMKNGGSCSLETARRVVDYIDLNRAGAGPGP